MQAAHRDGLNFRCSSCTKQYSKKEHLERHERSHTGARPFKCEVCRKGFSRRDVLQRHIKVHGDVLSPVVHTSPAHSNAEPANTRNISSFPSQGVQPRDSFQTAVSPIVRNSHAHDDAAVRLPAAQIGHAQHHLSVPQDNGAYLLWPDSELFLQNLMSWDPTAWDQNGIVYSNNPLENGDNLLDSQPLHQATTESPAARTGQRALQAINGLVRDTLSTVTAATELAQLTPRFLDSSLHMFFSRFTTMLPIIHRPSFTFDASAPLLLNAFAHGSLFLGTESAVSKGDALWKLAHTALATSWPSFISQKGEYDACSGVQLVQSAVLSQTYAAFSRNLTLRKTSQTFSGLSMHWAQYCGLQTVKSCPCPPSLADSNESKTIAWHLWVARETQLRAILGICIVDGVTSQFTGNPSTTWLTCNTLPIPSNDKVFSASNPDEWILAMENSEWRVRSTWRFCDVCQSLLYSTEGRIPINLELLDVRIILEVLNSMAMEARRISPVAVGIPAKDDIACALFRLRNEIMDSVALPSSDRSIAMLRWHAVCLDMIGSTSRGARRMCYGHGLTQNIYGGEWREEFDIDPTRWLSGDGAKRSLLHALEIQSIATRLPIGATHDIYLPGAIFSAATTYASFALYGVSKMTIPRSVDWGTVLSNQSPEGSIEPAAQNTQLFLTGGLGESPDVDVHNLVYDLVSLRVLLRGMAFQWGVMSEMETVVGEWVARCEQTV